MVAAVAGSFRIFEKGRMKALKKGFELWFIHSLNKHSVSGKHVVDGKLHDRVSSSLHFGLLIGYVCV